MVHLLLLVFITLCFTTITLNHYSYANDIQNGSAELKATVEKPDSISLHQAIQTAITNNYEIKAAFAQLPIEEANLIIAKYRPNPFLSSFNEFVSKGSLQPIRVGSEIELGKKRYWRTEEAKEYIGKVALEIEKKTWEIHTKVHLAYIELAVLQEKYNLVDEELNFYKSIGEEKETTKDRIVDLEDELKTLEWKLDVAQIELNDLLGQEPYEKIEANSISSIQPDIYLLESEKFLSLAKQAPEERLETQILYKEHKAIEAKLTRIKWERIPNITLEAAPVETQSMIGAFFGSKLPLPIFNRGQGERAKEEARLQYIDQELVRVKHKIKIEIATAIKKLEPMVKAFRTFDKSSLEKFEINDLTTQEAVTKKEEEYAKSKENYLNIVHKYHIALANLEKAVGVPLYNL